MNLFGKLFAGKEKEKEPVKEINYKEWANIENLSADIEGLVQYCKDEALKSSIQRLGQQARECNLKAKVNETLDIKICHEVDILASLIRIDYSASLEKINEISTLLKEREGL